MSVKGDSIENNLQRAVSVTSLNPDGTPQCNTHRKRMKFFCSKHELLLCSICAVKRHRLCDEVLTLEEAMDAKKMEGKKILDGYSRRLSMIEHAITDRRASRKLLDSSVQELQGEIHEVTQKLIDLLKSEERTLMQTLKNIQTSETESIEKDIARLESIKAKVKSSSNALAHDLSNSDIDLINAVVKEKQLGPDRYEDDGVVKKTFRDVDLKFSVSPHILSFLKNFKVLGQITLLEETNNNKGTDRSQSHTADDIPRRRNLETLDHNLQNDDSNISARARWERERQSPYQRRLERENSSSDRNVPSKYRERRRKESLEQTDNSSITNERPSSAMSLNAPRGTATHFTAYPARPSSIPVDVMIEKTRESRQMSPPYRYARAVPFNDSAASTTTNRSRFEQMERNSAEFTRRNPEFPRRDQRSPVSERNRLVDNPRSRSKSPNSPKPAKYPIVEIKDEDGRFGRSFAAVQINELDTTVGSERDEDVEVDDLGERQTIEVLDESFGFEANKRPSDRQPLEYQQRPGIRVSEMDRPTLDRDQYKEQIRTLSPAAQHTTAMVPDIRGRRWVHKAAFASNGLGSKRLISGITCLSDGRVILVDQEQYTVQMYDSAYRFLYEVKLESRPFDAVALSDNKIAVSLQTERVLKFFLVMDGALTPVADLGVPCDLVVYGFCRGGGNYFICCGEEIVVLSDQGRLVGRIKHDINGQGLFSRAEYIGTDRHGSVVYVSDVGNGKVMALQLDGQLLWEITSPGFQPAGIKLVENYIYVSDKGQHRIMLLNTDGHILKQNLIGRIENPCAVCLNMSRGLMFVTQMRYDAIVNSPRPIQVFQLQ